MHNQSFVLLLHDHIRVERAGDLVKLILIVILVGCLHIQAHHAHRGRLLPVEIISYIFIIILLCHLLLTHILRVAVTGYLLLMVLILGPTLIKEVLKLLLEALDRLVLVHNNSAGLQKVFIVIEYCFFKVIFLLGIDLLRLIQVGDET